LEKTVQIVSFNVPYPPDYGGVMDVYYKIKSLKVLGYQIVLHTFHYGRPRSAFLESICSKVYYYPRRRKIQDFFSSLPFIVKSRTNSELLKNLKNHNGLIILEGIHCTYPLWINALPDHRVFVRTHNVEYLYYEGLGIVEKNIFRKFYFYSESKKLKEYEISVLTNASHIICISPNDAAYFNEYFPNVSVIYPFHENDAVISSVGKGKYILIHADLSVPENIYSINWLLEKVVSKIKFTVIIAGKNPDRKIQSFCGKYSHVKLFPNPTNEQMNKLISEAQVLLIHSFYPQGMKLKLLNSLFKGRFVLVNSAVVQNTGLEELCTIANTPEDYLIQIHQLMTANFTNDHIRQREVGLFPYLPQTLAKKLIQLF